MTQNEAQNETDNNPKPFLAWHFIRKTEECPNGELFDRSPAPEDGVWLEHDVLTKKYGYRGLTAWEQLLDALEDVDGSAHLVLCRVECERVDTRIGNRLICRRMRILWRIDPEPALRAFARRCALDVVHLWDCPDDTLRYLKEGRDEDREKAENAAVDSISTDTYGKVENAFNAAAWAADSDPCLAAYRAADYAVESLFHEGGDERALKEHYRQLLEDMIQELYLKTTPKSQKISYEELEKDRDRWLSRSIYLEQQLEAIQKILSGRIQDDLYNHYKGDQYQLIGEAYNEADQELMAIYRCRKTFKTWTRKMAEFKSKFTKA